MSDFVIRTAEPSLRWALLYVRDALGLRVAPGYPPVVPRPPEGAALRKPELGDETTFLQLWEALGVADGTPPPQDALERFERFTSAVGSEALREWINGRKRGMQAVAERFPHTPEWQLRSLFASAGISTITVYPVVGNVARVLDGELLVSYETYVDLDAMRAILEETLGIERDEP